MSAESRNPAAFPYIVLDVLTRQGISQNKLAETCLTTPGSVSRWIRGSTPTRITRVFVRQKLQGLLKQQIDELQHRTIALNNDSVEQHHEVSVDLQQENSAEAA